MRIDYFEYPAALLLLLVVPLYMLRYFGKYRHRRLGLRITQNLTEYVPRSSRRAALRWLPFLSNWLAIICLIIALARPIAELPVEEVRKAGKDIFLLIDISASMEATDVSPNRLDVAKSVASRFLETRSGDRFGIILFSEDAFSYVPLTWDIPYVQRQLDRIQAELLPRDGTALGSAIALAITHFHDSEAQQPILVALTDGANNRGPIAPMTSAQLARRADIKMYCIAVGNSQALENTSSYDAALWHYPDSVAFRRMASITGGNAYWANDQQQLNQIFQTISQQEPQTTYTQSIPQTEEHHPFFLQIALISLISAFICMAIGLNNPLEY